MVSVETISPGQRPIQPQPELEHHLGYWLRRVSNHVSGMFAGALKAKHASVAEWVVLCQVHERPGITPGEIAAVLGLTRGALSKITNKLEAKNWIARANKPGDSRVQLLSPTNAGSRILPQLAAIADQNDKACFDPLNSDERDTLRRLLRKLSESHQLREVPME